MKKMKNMKSKKERDCVALRMELTEHLLLCEPLPRALARHLDGCADCAREAAEAEDVVRTLRRADPLGDWSRPRVGDGSVRPSGDLGERIGRDVAGAAAARSGRPRRRVAWGLAAVLVAAAAVFVPLTVDGDRGPGASVQLVREGRMVEHPWGTEVPVALRGLEVGETYRMMTVNADGVRTSGGSVRATGGGPVSLRMVTAMRRETITELVVEDDEGRVVTRVAVGKPKSLPAV